MDTYTVQMEVKVQKQEQLYYQHTMYRGAETAVFKDLPESSAQENVILAVRMALMY